MANSSIPQRNTVFSSGARTKIRNLLMQLPDASLEKKKTIRSELRQLYGFYISYFTSSKKGFQVQDFDDLIATGQIKIK